MLLKASVATAAAAVSLFANGVSAFSNTSPHLFFANANNLEHQDAAALRQANADSAFVVETSDFDKAVLTALEDCPADAYLFINIPGLHSADLASSSATTAALKQLYDASPEKFAYPYVTSSSSKSVLASEVAAKCKATIVDVNTAEKQFTPYTDATPRVIQMDFAQLPEAEAEQGDQRAAALQDDLEFAFSSVVHSLPSPNYVVVLSSSPAEAHVSTSKHGRTSKKGTKVVGGSLFDRYVYFGTGIFETTLVAFLLIFVLFAALAWLSDLKVSYKSFEKQQAPSSKAQ